MFATIEGFYEYVLSFYGNKDAIYPMGATLEQVKAATTKLINNNPSPEFDGDSFDRERVRDIMIQDYNLIFPTKV